MTARRSTSHPRSASHGRQLFDFTVAIAVRIVELCLAAQRPHLIVPALLDRCSPESVEAELAGQRAAAPSASRSIFGEPTREQHDALAEAVKRRFEAYAKGTAG